MGSAIQTFGSQITDRKDLSLWGVTLPQFQARFSRDAGHRGAQKGTTDNSETGVSDHVWSLEEIIGLIDWPAIKHGGLYADCGIDHRTAAAQSYRKMLSE
jgi:hypothetical protein